MNAEQKQRAADLLSAWRATAYALHADRMADLLNELLAATNPAQISSLAEPQPPAPSVPDGWQWVPIEPTPEMLRAGATRYTAYRVDAGSAMFYAYAAMLEAAPTPAEPPADVARDAERLDWLLRKLPGDAIRYCVGELSDTSDEKEFRDAIDAAIERQGGE